VVHVEVGVNAGYKGKIIIDVGAVYAPYNPFENITWQKYLEELQLKYTTWKLNNNSFYGLSDATELMKKRFPGNYCVIEKYDSITGKFVLKLEFTDPKEEIFWLLKWA
jgi:hypothetical protein